MSSGNAAAGEGAPRQGLVARWEALRSAQPDLRARDAAACLGVSEAELVAARPDLRVRRLDGPWGRLLQKLPGLGEVMALTRNDHAVHEKIGQIGTISVVDDLGRVFGDGIDLGIFFHRWRYGFAVTEAVRDRTRRSLQFFDGDGIAVHKVYARDAGRADAFDALVRKHLHRDRSRKLTVRSGPVPTAADALGVEADDLLARWRSLDGTHALHGMLRELGSGRAQALRGMAEDGAGRVPADGFQVALARAADLRLPVTVVVSNPGTVQIHRGPVHRLKRVGPWFNVLDPNFSLHLREDAIASTWVVRKPTRDGVVTSVEIFAGDGRHIAWLFGTRRPGETESGAWRELAASLGN